MQRSAKRAAAWVIVGFTVIVFGVVVVAVLMTPKSPPKLDTGQIPNKRQTDSVEATPNELVKSHHDNPVRLVDWLKGKTITITGPVTRVQNNSATKGGWAFAYVDTLDSEISDGTMIIVNFPESLRGSAGDLQLGDTVKTICTFDREYDHRGLFFTGKSFEIINPSSEPSQPLQPQQPQGQ